MEISEGDQRLNPEVREHLNELFKKFSELDSSRDNVRTFEALKDYVELQAQEMKGDNFAIFMESLSSRIKYFMKSNKIEEVKWGIAIVESLSGLEHIGNESLFHLPIQTLLQSSLRQAKAKNFGPPIIKAVASLLGRYAQKNPQNLTKKMVESELSNALEYLQKNNSVSREMGTIILTQIISLVPNLISHKLLDQEFLEAIWPPLGDPSIAVRLGCAEVMKWGLKCIGERTDISFKFYQTTYASILNGIAKAKQAEVLHGWLLLLHEMLEDGSSFMGPRYDNVCQICKQQFINQKTTLIRKTVIQMLPALARFNREKFCAFFPEISGPLIAGLRKDKEVSLIAFGEIAMILKDPSAPIVQEALQYVTQQLTIPLSKFFTRLEAIPSSEIFQCMGLFGQAFGEKFEPQIKAMIEMLVVHDFSTDLVNFFTVIRQHVPRCNILMEKYMMATFSAILYHSTSAVDLKWQNAKEYSDYFEKEPLPLIENNTPVVLLALRHISSFEFHQIDSNLLIQYISNYFLTRAENAEIRKYSALACCKQLTRKGKVLRPKGGQAQVINLILEKLMLFCLTDPDQEIIISVLQSLDPCLDRFLCQPEFMEDLFLFFVCDVLEIQELALKVLARLSKLNPSYILPHMRSTIVDAIRSLNQHENWHNREKTMKILGQIVAYFPKLVAPYTKSIVSTLLAILKAPGRSTMLTTYCINAIGEIALEAGEGMRENMDEILPIVIDNIEDQNSSYKRIVALETLIRLITRTGYIVDPVIKFPKLLPMIIDAITTAHAGPTRMSSLRVLGTLGAIDPYQHKLLQLALIEAENERNRQKEVRTEMALKIREKDSFFKEMLRNLAANSDDFYITTALEVLMNLLENLHGNSNIQSEVIVNVFMIFKSMGQRSLPFIKHFLQPVINVAAVCGEVTPSIRELVFGQLAQLVLILNYSMKDYVSILIQLIEDNWEHTYLLKKILYLLENIYIVLVDEFKPFLDRFISRILLVIRCKNSLAIDALHALMIFGILDDYLPLIIPVISEIVIPTNSTEEISKVAIHTVASMSLTHYLAKYALLIFRKITFTLENFPSMQQNVMKDICIIVPTLMQNDHILKIVIEMVSHSMKKKNIVCKEWDDLLRDMGSDHFVAPRLVDKTRQTEEERRKREEESEAQYRNFLKQNDQIIQVWDPVNLYTEADWFFWLNRISLTLLKHSSSTALRCLASLSTNHSQLAIDLFNVSFLCCYDQMTEEEQAKTLENIDNAFSSPTITSKVLHKLLDLAEYMERAEMALPLGANKLGAYAMKCRAFAKALYYIEQQYKRLPEEKLQDLIVVNTLLGRNEATQGILAVSGLKDNNNILWPEVNWLEAVAEVEQSGFKESHLSSPKQILHQIKCFSNLGHWKTIIEVSESLQGKLPGKENDELIGYMTRAVINEGKFERLEGILPLCQKREVYDTSLYLAILAISKKQLTEAEELIKYARLQIVPDLVTAVGESYSRAYDYIVKVQQLSELEEIITFLHDEDPTHRDMIRNLWMNRLDKMQRDVETWQSVISIRSLVINPREEPKMWTKFANLLRKQKRVERARDVLCSLMPARYKIQDGVTVPLGVDPEVHYSFLRTLWDQHSYKMNALNQMLQWTGQFCNLNISKQQKARCFVKLASWQLELSEGKLTEEAIRSMEHSCAGAIENHGDWYKARRMLANVNYRVVVQLTKESESHPEMAKYLLPAVTGFIMSIVLAPRESLQDTLRLLSLWFNHGDKIRYQKDVEIAMRDGFKKINCDNWLVVIPQIIARIHIGHVRNGVEELLNLIGQKHPHALVFPISVAHKDPIRTRVSAALSIMNNMRQQNAKLLNEVLLTSRELIRVSILWKEKWCKGLEEASHLYHNEKRVVKMLEVLNPLHQMTTQTDLQLTQVEVSFIKDFGKDLERAWDCCKNYSSSHEEAQLKVAWDIYAHIFRQIRKQLQDFDKLYLSGVSPELEKVFDSELHVPGTYLKTYKENKNIIRIKKFTPILKVIPSKQQPRKLVIQGSDGNEYPFLLKGHEDLRQDERAMQLFGLVNEILESHDITAKKHLNIQRYAAVPLSADSGLIEWLPSSDTLHELFKHYRFTHGIALDEELALIQRSLAKEDFYKLTIMNKLDIFENALKKTPGDDLERILWLQSSSSEIWLDKRTMYVTSLAVMSMVGYILGLGDRHPNNLMLNRNSGKIIHIDFGDCFEVATLREKFAEKVPFRLTKILINAMDVSGTEGLFRITCEGVMSVLREHKESILAVLEAFVYDPLINWKMGNKPMRNPQHSGVVGVEPSTNTNEEGLAHSVEGGSGGQNMKALTVLDRVSAKLAGTEFPRKGKLDICDQVDILIKQAKSYHTLCQAFLGWCPYW